MLCGYPISTTLVNTFYYLEDSIYLSDNITEILDPKKLTCYLIYPLIKHRQHQRHQQISLLIWFSQTLLGGHNLHWLNRVRLTCVRPAAWPAPPSSAAALTCRPWCEHCRSEDSWRPPAPGPSESTRPAAYTHPHAYGSHSQSSSGCHCPGKQTEDNVRFTDDWLYKLHWVFI